MNLFLSKGKYLGFFSFLRSYNWFNKDGFRNHAIVIRDEYLPRIFNTQCFNKAHFTGIVKTIKANLSEHILSIEDKAKYHVEATAENDFDVIPNNFSINEQLSVIAEEVEALLESKTRIVISCRG